MHELQNKQEVFFSTLRNHDMQYEQRIKTYFHNE